MTTQKLKIYMGHGGECMEGACLIFAHNVKEARKIAYPLLDSWGMVDEYIYVKAKLLRDEDFLYKQANQEKLQNGIAHAIECPEACSSCDTWGNSELVDGKCENCIDDEGDA